MKAIHITLFLVSCLLLNSCNKNGIKDRIVRIANQRFNRSDSCIIDMREVTNFKWDRFYLFPTGAGPENIDSALEFHYLYYMDTHEQLVFLLGNKITYHEANYLYADDHPHGGPVFDIFNSHKLSFSWDSSHSLFRVKKSISDKNIYYEITPINSTSTKNGHQE